VGLQLLRLPGSLPGVVMKHRIKVVDDTEIKDLMEGGMAIACSFCGGAARIPEDVVAVRQRDGRPLVCCQSCVDAFSERVKRDGFNKVVEDIFDE
jgi:hypothetical protein